MSLQLNFITIKSHRTCIHIGFLKSAARVTPSKYENVSHQSIYQSSYFGNAVSRESTTTHQNYNPMSVYINNRITSNTNSLDHKSTLKIPTVTLCLVLWVPFITTLILSSTITTTTTTTTITHSITGAGAATKSTKAPTPHHPHYQDQ